MGLKWRTVKDPVFGEAVGATLGYGGVTVVHIRVMRNNKTRISDNEPWLLTINKAKHERFATMEEAKERAEEWFAGFTKGYFELYMELIE